MAFDKDMVDGIIHQFNNTDHEQRIIEFYDGKLIITQHETSLLKELKLDGKWSEEEMHYIASNLGEFSFTQEIDQGAGGKFVEYPVYKYNKKKKETVLTQLSGLDV